MPASIAHILKHLGLNITRYEPVHGGDINAAYLLYGPGVKYFLKVNDAVRYPAMFEKERSGLKALQESTEILVPAVIKSGVCKEQQFLLLEWLEKGLPGQDCWENFGAGLAVLHRQQQPFFGWPEDNFIGSLPQKNQRQNEWHLFYRDQRIMPLVKILFTAGVFSKPDLAIADLFCRKMESMFPPEPPALVHGDLWSGNCMVTTSGAAAIFDPAVYFGHREMDIGMAHLFGGFNRQFFEVYNEVYPLEKNWQQRLSISQLYPLLVHAVLFGGQYIQRAKDIIKQYS